MQTFKVDVESQIGTTYQKLDKKCNCINEIDEEAICYSNSHALFVFIDIFSKRSNALENYKVKISKIHEENCIAIFTTRSVVI